VGEVTQGFPSGLTDAGRLSSLRYRREEWSIDRFIGGSLDAKGAPRGSSRGHAAGVMVQSTRRANRQIEELEAALAERFEQHPDAVIYLSMPGLGYVLGARALGESGNDLDRHANPKSHKNYAGTSPIIVASGKKKAVLARHVRNGRLYDAID